MSSTPLQVVNTFFNCLEKGDAAGVAGCFGDAAVVWTPGDHWFSGEHTPDEIQGLSGQILSMFPSGLQFEIEAMTSEGERIAVEAVSRGEHINGRVYSNTYHMLFVVRAGKIAVLKEYMDTALAGEFLGHDAPPSA